MGNLKAGPSEVTPVSGAVRAVNTTTPDEAWTVLHIDWQPAFCVSIWVSTGVNVPVNGCPFPSTWMSMVVNVVSTCANMGVNSCQRTFTGVATVVNMSIHVHQHACGWVSM